MAICERRQELHPHSICDVAVEVLVEVRVGAQGGMNLLAREALWVEHPVLVPKRGSVIPAALPTYDAGTIFDRSVIRIMNIQKRIQGPC